MKTLLLILCLLFACSPTKGTIVLATSDTSCAASAGTTCTMSETAPANAFVFVYAFANNAVPTVTLSTGTTANVITLTGARNNGTVVYFMNVPSGSLNIVTTRTAGVATAGTTIGIYTGVNLTAALDTPGKAFLANSAGPTLNSGSVADTTGDLVIGIFEGGGCTTISNGTGFALEEGGATACTFVDEAFLFEDQISTGTSVSATASGGGGNYFQGVFTFLPASSTPHKVVHRVTQNGR